MEGDTVLGGQTVWGAGRMDHGKMEAVAILAATPVGIVATKKKTVLLCIRVRHPIVGSVANKLPGPTSIFT